MKKCSEEAKVFDSPWVTRFASALRLRRTRKSKGLRPSAQAHEHITDHTNMPLNWEEAAETESVQRRASRLA